MIILDGDVDLQNGERVEVTPAESQARLGEALKGSKSKSRRSKTPSTKGADRLPGFGMWKDRWPKSTSTAEIARELAEQASFGGVRAVRPY